VNRILDQKKDPPGKQHVQTAVDLLHTTGGNVLGLLSESAVQPDTAGEKLDDLMEILLEVRADLRAEKNFKLTDKIRDALKEKGIAVKDTPDGSTWEIE
jgi:cysteinyl-tRNA synthetase